MTVPVIAIVDDYQPFRDYMSAFLRMRGYGVMAYPGGREVMTAVRNGVIPDLVLLDVMMPGLDGLETLRLLKESAPTLPVIMFSAKNEASTVVDAVRLGALDYLVKPENPDGVAEAALDAALSDALDRLERVKVLSSKIEPLHHPGRMAHLDPDVAAGFPHDAAVNEALRRVMRTQDESAGTQGERTDES